MRVESKSYEEIMLGMFPEGVSEIDFYRWSTMEPTVCKSILLAAQVFCFFTSFIGALEATCELKKRVVPIPDRGVLDHLQERISKKKSISTLLLATSIVTTLALKGMDTTSGLDMRCSSLSAIGSNMDSCSSRIGLGVVAVLSVSSGVLAGLATLYHCQREFFLSSRGPIETVSFQENIHHRKPFGILLTVISIMGVFSLLFLERLLDKQASV